MVVCTRRITPRQLAWIVGGEPVTPSLMKPGFWWALQVDQQKLTRLSLRYQVSTRKDHKLVLNHEIYYVGRSDKMTVSDWWDLQISEPLLLFLFRSPNQYGEPEVGGKMCYHQRL